MPIEGIKPMKKTQPNQVKVQPARIMRLNGKLYDFGTPNKSFLQVAKDLHTLGIKNCYFMLEIKDPSLVNIDPYASDDEGHSTLTKDQVDRIMLECSTNPWYYLREISKIPVQGGTSIRYRANRGNLAQAWCILHGYDSWLCLPRQKGKTESALAIQGWIYSFGTTNSTFIFINKDGDNSKANLRRLKAQLDLLPEYMRFDVYMDADGKNTKHVKTATQFRHPVNNNNIITKPKATSYDNALSLARGLSAPILHFDEPEFTPHIKPIIENSVSTFEEAARNAKKNNAMYARIFTCTPGDLDSQPGIQSQEILDKTQTWTEKIYDWTPDQIDAYIASKGQDCNKILYIEYQYYQIGLSQKWLADISAKIGNPLTVRREILLQRLHGSSMSPYPQEDIEYIVETMHKPIDELWLLDYFKFDIYEKLDRRIPYIMGVDCSTGTVGDNNAITIINPYTLRPVAEFECNFIGETLYLEIITELVVKYIPKTCVCIERNSIGDGIIDNILTNNTPIVNNLYYDKGRDLMEEKFRSAQDIRSILQNQARLKTYYGVYTSGTSREQMFAILSRRVSENKDDFITNNVIRDLSRLVRTASGKIEAGGTFHDDSIMSYLIGMYVYYHGDNLAQFGITRGARDEDLDNSGLKRPDEIDPTLVDPDLIAAAMEREKQEAEIYKFTQELQAAEKESQRETYRLHNAGMINDDIFSHTPDSVVDDYETSGTVSLDLF